MGGGGVEEEEEGDEKGGAESHWSFPHAEFNRRVKIRADIKIARSLRFHLGQLTRKSRIGWRRACDPDGQLEPAECQGQGGGVGWRLK
jgi:hypothetical protein